MQPNLIGIVLGVVGAISFIAIYCPRLPTIAATAWGWLDPRVQWGVPESRPLRTLRRVRSVLGLVILAWVSLRYAGLDPAGIVVTALIAGAALLFSPVAKSIPTAATMLVTATVFAAAVPSAGRAALVRRLLAGAVRSLLPGIVLFGTLLLGVGMINVLQAAHITADAPSNSWAHVIAIAAFLLITATACVIYPAGYLYCLRGSFTTYNAGEVHPYVPPLTAIVIAGIGAATAAWGAASGADHPFLPEPTRLVVGVGGPIVTAALAVGELIWLTVGPARLRLSSQPSGQ